MGIKVPLLFSPRVFTPRIEIERETERYAARVHIVRGIHVHGNGIRLRDFEIRLKGNIPRFSSRILPRKRSLAFLSHSLSLLRTLSKIRNKRPWNESKRWHKHRISSRRRNSEGEGDGSYEGWTEKREPSVRFAKIYVPGILRMDAPSARNSSCPFRLSSMLLQLQCP